METLQIAQQEVQDDPRNLYTTQALGHDLHQGQLQPQLRGVCHGGPTLPRSQPAQATAPPATRPAPDKTIFMPTLATHESSSTSTPSRTRTTPDKSNCLESVPSMGKPISEECATGMETEQTTPGKTSTQFRNQETAFNITRNLDQGSTQDGSPPLPSSLPAQATAPPTTRPIPDKTRTIPDKISCLLSALRLRGGTLSPRSHQLNLTYRLLCSTEDSKSICLMSFPFLLFLWPVSHPPLANKTSAVEAKQIAQHSAQVTHRGQQTSPGKQSYQPQNRDTAICFNRSELRLFGTPLTRPPPEPPPAAGEGNPEPDPDIKTKTEPRTNAASHF